MTDEEEDVSGTATARRTAGMTKKVGGAGAIPLKIAVEAVEAVEVLEAAAAGDGTKIEIATASSRASASDRAARHHPRRSASPRQT